MRPMAIGADRSFLGSSRDSVPMYALLVRSDHLSTKTAFFHHELLAVTSTAGRGDVLVVDA